MCGVDGGGRLRVGVSPHSSLQMLKEGREQLSYLKRPVVIGNDLLGSYTHLILQVLQELWAWSEDAL